MNLVGLSKGVVLQLFTWYNNILEHSNILIRDKIMTVSALLCPITLATMKDPVLAPDGYTYERSSIKQWLQKHGTSPQTRQRMNKKDLVPNRALYELLQQHNAPPSASTSNQADDAQMSHVSLSPKTCSDELYQLILSTTKATLHVNTHNEKQSIIHIDTPNFSKTVASSHICCVIDISGSMGAEAATKDEQGYENKTGLSILDIVKFATLVISKSLEYRDKLSIVTYSSTAQTMLKPTFMDELGKKEVERVLANIEPQTTTNLWHGIQTGVELANEVGTDYINSIFVLTDGIPNIHPPLGYLRSMKKLLKNLPLFGTVSTFGFGYSLDSPVSSMLIYSKQKKRFFIFASLILP